MLTDRTFAGRRSAVRGAFAALLTLAAALADAGTPPAAAAGPPRPLPGRAGAAVPRATGMPTANVRELRIVSAHRPPLVIVSPGTDGGQEQFSGMLVDLLPALLATAKISTPYRIYSLPNVSSWRRAGGGRVPRSPAARCAARASSARAGAVPPCIPARMPPVTSFPTARPATRPPTHPPAHSLWRARPFRPPAARAALMAAGAASWASWSPAAPTSRSSR